MQAIRRLGASEEPLCSPRELWVLAALILVALLKLRLVLWRIPSGDTHLYFVPWVNFIHAHGGWQALKYPFAEYFPAYLYLLVGTSYLGRWLLPIEQIKIIPGVFDIVTAVMAYRIIRLLQREDGNSSSVRAVIAFLAIMALPSLLLDGAIWGQCDSIYVSLLLATVYYLMRNSPVRSSLYFGLALCFKFQAVFLVPVLLAALLRRRFAWWHVLIVPALWIAATIPAILAGASWRNIVGLFAKQSELFPEAAMNVANPYEFLHVFHLSNTAGIRIGMVVALVTVACLVYSGMKQRLWSPYWVFFFSTATLVFMPYVLPKMHDRYFLPGQVCLVILCFYRSRFVVAAALLELALLLPYVNFFGDWRNRNGLLTAAMASTAVVLLLAREIVRMGRIGTQEELANRVLPATDEDAAASQYNRIRVSSLPGPG